MEHFKQFFKDKGLYLACLAVVFAATAAGVLALRGILNHFANPTQLRGNQAQEDAPWQDDAAVNQPDTAQPEPTRTPAPTTAPSPTPAVTPAPEASSAPAASSANAKDNSGKNAADKFWKAQPLAPFSGDELVYNATLGDWRTHNGIDLAAPAGTTVPAARAGRVTQVQDDALWGGVVEVTDADGALWRYCGLDAAVVPGDDLAQGAPLGTAAALPAESELTPHIHLEYLVNDTYKEPPV